MSDTWEKKTMARLSAIFKETLLLADDVVVTKQMSPDNVANWDSLTHIALMSAVEQEFGMQFTLSELGSVGSVDNVLAVLSTRNV